MRIGLFHCDLPQRDRKIGGVSVAVHRLANALAENPEDHITVFSLDAPPADAAYRHVRLFERWPWLRMSKIARLLVLPVLLNFVDFGPLDILHLHGDDWFYLRRKTGTVRTLHGSALREAQTSTSWKRRIAQYLIFPLEHLSARLAGTCLAVGEDAGVLYRADRIVDNGVDLSRFCPGNKSVAPLILFVGTWRGRKRGEFLFRAFVNAVLPRLADAELVMVSDHSESASHVTWVKSPDDTALAVLYRRAWVFAYPSLYEGFGIPYLEAMASGTAVLASPNSGARYVLQDGRAGVIADDATFAQQLVELIVNRPFRQEYERRGLNRAAGFSWDIVAGQHRAIYESMLEQEGKQTYLSA